MAIQVEAQIHEESELWSTSYPFSKLGNRLPSQSEMQGRKPEEEIQQPAFSHGYAKSRGGVVVGLRAGLSERQFRMAMRNFAHHEKPQEAAKEFHTACEISHGMQNLPVHRLC